jgi:hypothetical protein
LARARRNQGKQEQEKSQRYAHINFIKTAAAPRLANGLGKEDIAQRIVTSFR